MDDGHASATVDLGEDTRTTYLHNGECLVVQQLFLPQIIIQHRPAQFPIMTGPIRADSGRYLLRSLEPFKIVFDDGFEDERSQFETSRAGESVEGHSGGGYQEIKGQKDGLEGCTVAFKF